MSLKIWLPLNGALENNGIGNYTITKYGLTTTTTGKISNTTYNFSNSTNNYITIMPSPLATNSDFSYCCWFKTTNLGYNQTIMTSRTAVDVTGFSIFYISTDHVLRFDDGASMTTPANVITAANTWYHLAFTRNNTTKNIYVNGQLVISDSINTPSKLNAN